MRIFFRGFARDVRNFFRPWQNMDKVRAEVKRARKNAQRIAKRPNVNQPLKRVDETQAQWMNRRDNEERVEVEREETAIGRWFLGWK